jgi:hypothetical protein
VTGCGTAGAACAACDVERANVCTSGACGCNDGPACQAGQRCTTGGCQCACYNDHDNDGFFVRQYGACPCPRGTIELPTPPARLDCDDNDSLAYPGQPGYSSIPRVSGGYDFNCDGAEESGYHYDAGTCTGRDAVNDCLGVVLWEAAPPACGVLTNLVQCTQQITTIGTNQVRTCVPWSMTTPLRQTCR